ncbi:MAG: hypothetical protein DMG05_24405 [Acidobacteria bacterium]|nr:MAG: hypothetical protein DMG05_24405 [Acidobacteriota bacterium]
MATSSPATELIKKLLDDLGFPTRFNTEQTALCVLALADQSPQTRLILGKRTLREGARIHDIIEFGRHTLGKTIAENTRESLRKTSIKYLVDFGLVEANSDDPQRPTNSGLWHYVATAEFLDLIDSIGTDTYSGKVTAWRRRHPELLTQISERQHAHRLSVTLPDGTVTELSPGAHNELEKQTIEVFIPKFVQSPRLLYLGDAAEKMRFIDERDLARRGITFSVHEKLPDVVVASKVSRRIYNIEAVTSVGPVTDLRKKEITALYPKKTSLVLVTAFPTRSVFRKFSDQIAWGTFVWIADEPDHLIRFNGPEI